MACPVEATTKSKNGAIFGPNFENCRRLLGNLASNSHDTNNPNNKSLLVMALRLYFISASVDIRRRCNG